MSTFTLAMFVIQQMDSYDAGKDALYRIYLLATVIGVGGAWAGIVVLWRQNKALVSAQRGWVVANQVGQPPNPIYSPDSPFYTPGLVFVIEVIGNSPVKIFREQFRCRIVKADTVSLEPVLEKVPSYLKPMFTGSAVYPPGGPKMARSIGLESGPLTVEQFEDLKHGRSILCAYGRIDYLDAFKEQRMTQMCVIYNFSWGGQMKSPDGTVLNPPGFIMGGPEAYNQVT